MTPQHPAAPETETDANDRALWLALRQTLVAEWRDDYSVVSIVDALTETVERIVAERVRVVEGERDECENNWRTHSTRADLANLRASRWMARHDQQRHRAESAEAAHEAEKAAHERLRAEFGALAKKWRSQDNTGEWGNHDKTFCAMDVEDLLGGGGAR